MTPKDWSEIERLYYEAIDRPPAERAAFVTEACGGDKDLLSNLQALLRAHEDAPEFLDKASAFEIAARAAATELNLEVSTPPEIGTRLGSYEVVSLIGAGGMGRVFLARDTKLKRQVAIKVLPPEFAQDVDRVTRFQREAEMLASLNHPNIATIHDVQHGLPTPFLVLELVEGETLAERIEHAPIPCEEALKLAVQIAEGLESAHGKDIVHRDLKPANIKITPEGKVKILDFGLAKALETRDTDRTLESHIGMVLGTAPYMSPEQARGQILDRTSDNWAFGCVVYEMLAGKRAFGGGTAAEIVSNVLTAEPDWSAVPPDTPSQLRLLLSRCLQKDPRRRLQHIGDARIELEQVLTEPSAAAPLRKTPALRRAMWFATAAVVVLFFMTWAVIFLVRMPQPSPLQVQLKSPPALEIPAPALRGGTEDHGTAPRPQVRMSEIKLPSGGDNGARTTISPDGKQIAFRTKGSSGDWVIAVQSLETLIPRLLEGTDAVARFSWSPDSKSIVFCHGMRQQFGASKLKRIDVETGKQLPLAECGQSGRARPAWGPNGVILFTGVGGMLRRVSASGSDANDVTKIEFTPGEGAHLSPSFLPDGRHFLYTEIRRDTELSAIFVGSLDSKTKIRLMPSISKAIYAPPGLILYLREDDLMARPFDATRLAFTGDSFVVAENITHGDKTTGGAFDVSNDGTLIYSSPTPVAPATEAGSLMWAPKNGATPLLARAGSIGRPTVGWWMLSPDGKRLAWADEDTWVYDFRNEVPHRLPSEGHRDTTPVWSPDGTRLVVQSSRAGRSELYIKAADGSRPDQLLYSAESGAVVAPFSWSMDLIVFTKTEGPDGARDLWILPMTGSAQPFPYMTTPYDEYAAALSPDGRWLAYVSNEEKGGRNYEVFVQSFPNPLSGDKSKISKSGGWAPRWSQDLHELFYLTPEGRIVAVTVGTAPAFSPGRPISLDIELGFPGASNAVSARAFPYDVSSNGQRFLIRGRGISKEDFIPVTLKVISNWAANLKH